MKHTHLTQFVLSLALLGLAPAAFSQYIWLNEKGNKQFSDMPPPASVPQNRILKEPGQMPRGAPASTSEPAAADTGAAAAGTAAKEPMTTAEKNADFQKRRAEQAAKDKKSAEEAKYAAEKDKYCAAARSNQRTLASGQRMARVDSKGEIGFLSDAQRAKELQEAKSILSDCQ